ncbi:molybdopterin molybdotransferase MoeA [Pallidibacillus thermolactis]|uniref:molybdopterin molybdotransferase MoeA n=1 Tax=Pallidibacillus thermolactis TaxID=251051 RepID=UPI002954E23A|nr:gephyrin-like molybdotransferase Glp [Pallidibacillus thermolactis]
MEKRKPIKVEQALKRVFDYARYGSIEYVSIEDSYGRYLGEDLVATHDVPFFNRSPYDGYAIRACDTVNASRDHPIEFKVIGEIGAGSVFDGVVGENEAVRIMTGAQIPDGADSVIMLELVTESEPHTILIKRKVKQGENISFIGEDTKQGTVLAKKGTYINPGIVALLATFGYKQVPVSTKPKIGIIATGSELVKVDAPLEPGKIRNSNTYMIVSQIKRAGGKPIYFGQFKDDFQTCFKQVKHTLDRVDFLITTGGVSVGDYDYLPAIYEKLGANVLFNKIAMRPGSVTTVAEKNGKLLFGLSGNPSACYVGCELFVKPIIRKFLHHQKPVLKRAQAVLGQDFPKANPFDRFVRGYLNFVGSQLYVYPVGLDKSNVVSSLASANVLLVLPGGTRGFTKGTKVDVLLLEDQEGDSVDTFLAGFKNYNRGDSDEVI